MRLSPSQAKLAAASWIALAVAGCSSKSNLSTPPDAPDASTSTTEATASAPSLALAPIARSDVFAARLAAARPLVRDGAGFRVERTRWSSGASMLPSRADAPLRLDAGRSGVFVEVSSLDLAPADAKRSANALVFEDARPATDLVFLSSASVVEELRVLRSSEAKTTARYRLVTGPAVSSVRVVSDAAGDRLEILDVEGVVRIATEPAFAVDAQGTRRAVTMTLSRADDGAYEATASLDPAGMAYPIVVDPTWQMAPTDAPLSSGYDPLVAYLPSGKLFVFGGSSSTALFDPTAESWSSGKPFPATYLEPWGVPLSTGKLLVGGRDTKAYLWTEADGPVETGSLPLTLGGGEVQPVHVDAGLPTERVYFFGGRSGYGSGTIHTATQRYDDATGTFSYAAPMPSARAASTTVLLPGNEILVAGGFGSASNNLDTALLYDPASDTFQTLASKLPTFHRSARAVTLPSGKVFIIGGEKALGTATESTVFYDPATKTFSPGPPMAWARRNYGLVRLSPTRIMVLGGSGRVPGSTGSEERLSSVEVYDADTNTWTTDTPMGAGRWYVAAALLSGGRVLAAGGSGVTRSWEIYTPDPVTCTTSSPGCNCVDGYCCDTACTGQCQACDVEPRKGICTTIVGEAPHGARPACTPTRLCGAGGSCATTCSSDAACSTTSWCNGGACAPKKANGAGCAAGNECTSGVCADGVCCDRACDGQCEACDVAGAVGACTNVTGAPHGAKPACTGGYGCSGAGACATTCTSDAQCAPTHHCAAGACVLKSSNGDACTGASGCQSGFCVDGRCCDTACEGACHACDVVGKAGTCSPLASGAPHAGKSCGAYAACTDGACATSCTADAQCASGHLCIDGACVARKANGSACGTPGECQSGFCADGVCCDAACTGECESCGLAGSVGTCAPRPATHACGLAGCVGAATVTRGTCSGVDATCTQGTVTVCPGALECADATSCKTSCSTGDDCVTGACDAATGQCVTSWDGGVPDSGAEAGPDGGVGEDATPIADAPAPSIPATPVVSGFQRCSTGSDCATGFCVEGVCCDSPCQETCHSCALLTSPGKCTPEPTGVDLKNECGPANSCLGTCGPGAKCIGAGAGTMCGRNRCTGPTQGIGPAYCAGPGATCPVDDVVPFECGAYICEPAFGACRSDCSSSADCANGYVCDVPSKTCVAAATPSEDTGCSVPAPGGSAPARTGAGLLARLVAAAGVARARRASTTDRLGRR